MGIRKAAIQKAGIWKAGNWKAGIRKASTVASGSLNHGYSRMNQVTPYTPDVCPKAANSNSPGAQEEHDCSNTAIAMQMEPHEARPRRMTTLHYRGRSNVSITSCLTAGARAAHSNGWPSCDTSIFVQRQEQLSSQRYLCSPCSWRGVLSSI